MKILGISAYYHDSAACILRDGELLAAAQEERFSRKKHDAAFPSLAIDYCLKDNQLTLDDIDLVAFYDKPFIKFERILETYMAYAPKGIRSFVRAIPLWMKKKLWIKDLIQKELQYEGKILFPEHHESHAAAAFFPSPFERAAILTTDGVGEWTTTSFGVGNGNRIELLADIHFPHSLGLLYSAFTYYTGFRVNSGEYKMMGLAPYGQPVYRQTILDNIIDLKSDGSFKLNMDYFNYGAGLTMTNDRFHRLFGGPPRRPESRLEQRHMDLAHSIQVVIEEAVLRMARHIRKSTDEKYLCLAGGVALNCVANGRLLQEGLFDNIWIQPAAGDAGGAVGAAMLAWYQYLDNPREADNQQDLMHGAYLGPEFSSSDIRIFLEENQIPFSEYPEDELLEKTSDILAHEKVVGWFQGRMEFGPRALGNRSIIGDARSPEMQATMNLKIKFRESFRPFAPSVLIEQAGDYFEQAASSPYMLLTTQIRKLHLKKATSTETVYAGLEKLKRVRSDIPAITHVDNSARLQTVDQNTNPRYHALLTRFAEKTGCPVIINTSFNVRGEPIVCTPEDAYRCFMRTNMDFLVLGDFMLDKKDQPHAEKNNEWQQEFELD